ncbi:MAG: hypothetical protein K2J61_03875, partial [Clostridia bacterium]|nr:hypothetical protein [Clostridia bacterium]
MLYILTPIFCVALCVGAVFSFLKFDNNVTANAAVAESQSVFTGGVVGTYSKSGANPRNISYATVAAADTNVASSVAEMGLTPGTGTMSASSNRKTGTVAYLGYIAFQADILVPAYTTYKVTYKFDITLTITRSGNTSTGAHAELLYFGDSQHGGSDMSSSLSFNTDAYSIGASSQEYSRKILSGLTGPSVDQVNQSDTVTISDITYINNTSAPIHEIAYFGYHAGNTYSGTGSTIINSTLSLNKETVIAELAAPSVDVDSITYDGSDHNFTFTYDTLRASVTKAEYVNMAGTTTTTYNKVTSTGTNPLDSNNVMTAQEAGTYTLYFDINANSTAMWNVATNDRNTKTVSFTINPAEINVPQTVTANYSGGDLTLNSVTPKPAWYDNLIYTDTSIMTLSPAKVKDANESGHTVTATIVSQNYVWSDNGSNSSASRTFAFKVNRKALTIEFEEKDGLKVAKFSDESEIFTSDKDVAGKPTFTLKTKYYEDGAHPNSAVDNPNSTGNWVAMAVIEGTGAANYKVDATEAFNLSKKQVAYPTLSASSGNSEVYDGTQHEFTFTGFDPATMNAPAVPTGADSFDGTTLKATNAGKYTPVFTLKDTAMYEWSGTAPGAVEITPKPVVINSDSANAASWEKGTATTLTFNVPTPLCGSDTTVNLVATYTLNGGDAQNCTISVNGKTATVTIGKGFAKGNYVLTVKT